MNTGNENTDDDADHGFGPMAMVLHRAEAAAAAPQKPRKRRRTIYVPKKSETTASSQREACTECGKEFFSRKALFGHMRCHPEREWRGINPPRRRLAPATSSDAVEYEIAACLLLLAAGGREVFECSSCKKVFRSHQALGGHRASHKNVKGCFAMAARPGSSSAHGLLLDLNLPPATELEPELRLPDECCLSSSSDILDLRLAL